MAKKGEGRREREEREIGTDVVVIWYWVLVYVI